MKYGLAALALIAMLYSGTQCFLDFSLSGGEDFTALFWGICFYFTFILGVFACYKHYKDNQK
jgi:hypothetical protein